MKWKELQNNIPSRSDYYLMQIAQKLMAGKKEPKLDSLRIRFEKRGPKKPNPNQISFAKSQWMSRVGKVRKQNG